MDAKLSRMSSLWYSSSRQSGSDDFSLELSETERAIPNQISVPTAPVPRSRPRELEAFEEAAIFIIIQFGSGALWEACTDGDGALLGPKRNLDSLGRMADAYPDHPVLHAGCGSTRTMTMWGQTITSGLSSAVL